MADTKRICTVLGCNRTHRSKGYCGLHYDRMLRRGTTELTPHTTTECAYVTCTETAICRGLCRLHYSRLRRNGTTELKPRPVHAPKPCQIDGCSAPVESRGWCRLHYGRWQRNGDPQVKTLVQPRSELDAFLAGFAPGDENECWNWQGALSVYGYGVFGAHPQHKAHRFAYQTERGEIPDGMMICHTCDNRRCVNPRHLYAGTYQDNADDRWSKAPVPRPNPELALSNDPAAPGPADNHRPPRYYLSED